MTILFIFSIFCFVIVLLLHDNGRHKKLLVEERECVQALEEELRISKERLKYLLKQHENQQRQIAYMKPMKVAIFTIIGFILKLLFDNGELREIIKLILEFFSSP